jgi:hypothetical protein
MNNQLIRFLSIFLLSLFVMNCGGASSHLHYGLDLKTVERPKDPKIPYGDITTKTREDVDEKGKSKYFHDFSDDLIEGFFYFTQNSIGFQLKNKTSNTMKIHWDNCAFITSDGETKRVVHEGVKLTDRNSPQPSSVLVRNGKLTDSLTPSDNIYFNSASSYGGWEYMPLFQSYTYLTLDMAGTLEKAKTNYIGTTCAILLSFEIEGVLNDYIFSFDINSVELQSIY